MYEESIRETAKAIDLRNVWPETGTYRTADAGRYRQRNPDEGPAVGPGQEGRPVFH